MSAYKNIDPRKNQHILERFLSKIDKNGANGCWIWKGTINAKGYGVFGYNGRMELAHRMSWTLFRDKIPKNTNVIRKCTNILCVNPDHLKLYLRNW